jgi:hypothetical protein
VAHAYAQRVRRQLQGNTGMEGGGGDAARREKKSGR